MRPGSCQWCPVTGQEATGTNKSTKGVICTSGSTFVFCIVRRIEQGNQRHFEVCLLRGICSLTGHSSEHPSLCAPGRGGAEADGLGSPCQPQPFCDSGVMDNCFQYFQFHFSRVFEQPTAWPTDHLNSWYFNIEMWQNFGFLFRNSVFGLPILLRL